MNGTDESIQNISHRKYKKRHLAPSKKLYKFVFFFVALSVIYVSENVITYIRLIRFLY